MNGYTKLFNSIITSTIWTEDDKTRLVWITMLALADRNGEVQGSIPGLARLAGVSTEATEVAIGKFLSPDKHSRTKDDEGRRIEEIDGGWHLLNHSKYREMASRDESKSANAERQKRFRERQKRNADNNGEVTESNGTVTHPLHIAEAEADCTPNGVQGEQVANTPPRDELFTITPLKTKREANASDKKKNKGTQAELEAYAEEIDLEASDGAFMFEHWESNGWRNGSAPVKDWRAGMRKWKAGGWFPSQKQVFSGRRNGNSNAHEQPMGI